MYKCVYYYYYYDVRGRLRWFMHPELKSVNDWVSGCRNMVVGVNGGDRGRKTHV